MKKFNKSISILISIDSIAEKLLATINIDNPHRELITESIIGDLNAKGRLTNLYNALNGWRDEINLVVGKLYNCSAEVYDYTNQGTAEEPIWKEKYTPAGRCMIISIDEYAETPVVIEYHVTGRDGKPVVKTKEVSIKSLTEITE